MSDEKRKMRKIVVHRAMSDQNEPGVLVPPEATVVDVSLDVAGEHGSVVFYTEDEVEVDVESDAEEA